MFGQDTLEAARNDDETQVVERLRHKAKYVRKLQDLFTAIGGSKDQRLVFCHMCLLYTEAMAWAVFCILWTSSSMTLLRVCHPIRHFDIF